MAAVSFFKNKPYLQLCYYEGRRPLSRREKERTAINTYQARILFDAMKNPLPERLKLGWDKYLTKTENGIEIGRFQRRVDEIIPIKDDRICLPQDQWLKFLELAPEIRKDIPGIEDIVVCECSGGNQLAYLGCKTCNYFYHQEWK